MEKILFIYIKNDQSHAREKSSIVPKQFSAFCLAYLFFKPFKMENFKYIQNEQVVELTSLNSSRSFNICQYSVILVSSVVLPTFEPSQ